MPNGYFNIDFLSTTESHYTIGPSIRGVHTIFSLLISTGAQGVTMSVCLSGTICPIFIILARIIKQSLGNKSEPLNTASYVRDSTSKSYQAKNSFRCIFLINDAQMSCVIFNNIIYFHRF